MPDSSATPKSASCLRSLVKALRADVSELLPPLYRGMALNSLITFLNLNGVLLVKQGSPGSSVQQSLEARIRWGPRLVVLGQLQRKSSTTFCVHLLIKGRTRACCRRTGPAALVGVSELGRLLADPEVAARVRQTFAGALDQLAMVAIGAFVEDDEVAAAVGAPRLLRLVFELMLLVRWLAHWGACRQDAGWGRHQAARAQSPA